MSTDEIKSGSFGDRLAFAIRKAGLTQKTFAERLETGASSITNYVKGRNFPEAKTLMCIADELNISIDWLVGRETQDTNGRMVVREEAPQYGGNLEVLLGEDLASFARDAAGSLPGGAEEFVRDLVKAKRAESERLTDRSEEPPPRQYPIPNRKPARKTHES